MPKINGKDRPKPNLAPDAVAREVAPPGEDERCAFRPLVLGALAKEGIAWRTVFENGSFDATASTVRVGLAVTAWLASTVPDDLEVLSALAGLPALPTFAICLRLPATVQPVVEAFTQYLLQTMAPDTAVSINA